MYINTDTTVQFTEAEFANNESVPIEEFQRIKNLLELRELECWNKSQLIVELNNEITQLSHQLEDQNHEIDDLKKKLIEVQDQNKVPYEQWNSHIEQLSHQLGTQTHEIKDLKKKITMEKNKVLVEEWNLHFSNQPKRINSIIEIALAERDSL
ncbi:15079_t:CDS:2, partial [Entrophospora sp. SA101]